MGLKCFEPGGVVTRGSALNPPSNSVRVYRHSWESGLIPPQSNALPVDVSVYLLNGDAPLQGDLTCSGLASATVAFRRKRARARACRPAGSVRRGLDCAAFVDLTVVAQSPGDWEIGRYPSVQSPTSNVQQSNNKFQGPEPESQSLESTTYLADRQPVVVVVCTTYGWC